MYKRFPLALTAAFLWATCLSTEAGFSQVTPDGTLSTTVTSPDGRNFTINDGDRAGNNLYHSFRDFSVPTGGSAVFNNATDVQNIFSRVTGGNVSNIDGLIRANGTANLYLMNPAGILFGPNASLNIGGAFVGTTANSIRFADNVEFSATQTSGAPLLTVSAPVGLQMGSTAGSIQVQGTPAPNFLYRVPQVFQAQSVALVGSQIDINSASLNVPDGRVELWAVQNAEVGLDDPSGLQLASSSSAPDWGTISLQQSSAIDTSGLNGGAIHIRGRDLTLQDGSGISSITGAGGRGAGINVQTTESVNLLGASDAAQYSTPGIYTSVSGNGARAGDITVETRHLNIANGGWLQSILGFGFDPVTFMPFPITDSRTGDITVRASDVELSGYNPFPDSFFHPSAITTLMTGGSRNVSGDINIDAERVRLINGGRISTDLLGFNIPGFAESSTSGTSGNISIRAAESLDIEGVTPFGMTGAVISSIQPFASGQGGNIAINTGRLRLANGGTISSALAGSGQAGNIDIQATDISVSDPFVDSYSNTVSGITVAVSRDAVGQGGNIALQGDRLHVFNGGQVTSSTQGNGAAGNINLRVNTIDVQGISQPLLDGSQLPSAITASSTTAANAGSVAIKADTVRVHDQAEISVTNSGTGNAGTLQVAANAILLDHDGNLLASTLSGSGGNMNLQANTIRLGQGSSINVSTETGHGGDLQLQVRDTLQLNGQSQILADAHQAGRSGNVRITASNTVLNDRSRISTNAQGTAVGGALSIQSDRLSLSNGSRITATTSGTGSGGRITIGDDRVSLSNGSQITASTTGTGRAGSLTIRANDGISLSGSNTRLAATSTTDAAAGSILLQTPDLQLDNHAAISVSGQGQGGAGNLTVRANTIQLNRKSTLSADVAGGDQGNISLQSNLLLLRRGSRISTNATGTASGGNIAIDTDFIAAVEGENSDITANATNSFGGRISIEATGIFGTEFRPQLTPFSDITASSGLGAAYSGTVSISNPDVDPGSDVVQLPEDVVDASNQVATGCGEYAHSRFIATGRGGIPNNPSEQVTSDRPWSDVRDISSLMNTTSNSGTTAAVPEPVTAVQITEINSWVRTANGHVELVAVTPHEPDFTHATCSATSGQ